MPDEISISEKDLAPRDTAQTSSNPTETIDISLQDLENADLIVGLHQQARSREINLGEVGSVVVGFPFDNQSQRIIPPDRPHVFTVDDLFVQDGKYTERELQENPAKNLPDNPKLINLGKTTIIFGHGIKKGNSWEYGNGQSITKNTFSL
ncbi:hypothetical protein HZB78_04305 [Candidatus Collierbacteria bacterium]|nr:hypothetical protein [Candidatus Collierbacteria bacterium]